MAATCIVCEATEDVRVFPVAIIADEPTKWPVCSACIVSWYAPWPADPTKTTLVV